MAHGGHGGNGKGGGASTEMWFGKGPIGVKKISTLSGHLSIDKLTFNMLLYCNSINNNVQ